MNTKMTELEKSWVLYDVGNSAFTLLITTIIPIYFNYLAQSSNISSVDYLAYWGYAASIVTLIVAFAGPVLGTIADTKDFKKSIFTISLIIGSLGCVLMGFASTWILFLFLFMVAKIGYSSSLIFYDAMLTDVTTAERMDSLSSKGYAWGYIGSCVPFIVCLLIVLNADKLSLSMQTAMIIDFVLIVFWWVGCTLPLLKNYKQIYYVEKNNHPIRASFSRLASTFRNIKGEKKVFLFLIAFFFYIDGVYTIIDMATAYGEALGFDSNALLLALLLTQFVAFPFSILFGKLSQKFPSEQLITVCIIAYFAIAIFAMFMYLQIHFWILAVLVGMFQGGIQALSRSYFAKIIPAEKAGEFFGLMDICGKGASFVGTSLVSIISQITGNINLGVGAIAILFLFGIFFFRKTVKAS